MQIAQPRSAIMSGRWSGNLLKPREVSGVLVIWCYEVDMTNTQSLSQFVERYHSWISSPALKATQILLTVARARLDVFLREAFLAAQTSKITANQFAHIHARKIAVYIF
ncbi:hypothetical protein AS026_05425 [Rhizobium altiplani]|nr:hypothetical protein AS026_05425 [Rhizobium altiplani]